MKVHLLTFTSVGLTLTAADLYTIANGAILIDDRPQSASISGSFNVKAQGSTILGVVLGGDSNPVVEVQPSYYPKAIMGAECAAVVTSLSWADQNLNDGYQFFPTARGYFVAGVLNSSQTDANDPFASAEIVASQVSCWKENYSRTFNLYA